ncbi:hypothetical protein AB0N77_20525 [Streptomyces misionensis]|uniref:hypothetical protein n=1 Tax=Streptomyces misionensis TaxID=67331 RepID=UPI00342ACB7D
MTTPIRRGGPAASILPGGLVTPSPARTAPARRRAPGVLGRLRTAYRNAAFDNARAFGEFTSHPAGTTANRPPKGALR